MDDNFQKIVSKTLTGLLVNQQEMTAAYKTQAAQTKSLSEKTKSLSEQTKSLSEQTEKLEGQTNKLVGTSTRHEELLQDLTEVMTVFAQSQVDIRKEQTDLRETLDECVRRLEALEDKKAS